MRVLLSVGYLSYVSFSNFSWKISDFCTTQIDPQAEFLYIYGWLIKFMAAFWLSRKTAVNIFFG